MPKIYLSPSLQEWNKDVFGNTEEENMNKIADAMEPYLIASGIQFTRNDPSQTLTEVIAQSNAGNYDVHLALHSNAAPEKLAGKLKGADAYYAPNSVRGKRLADIIVKNYKNIYPYPDKVRAIPVEGDIKLGEVTKTKAPAVLFEVAYHDNPEEAQWILDNINNIAKNIVQSLCEYFGIPFKEPSGKNVGLVSTKGSNLNIREKPSISSSVIGRIPNGSRVYLLGKEGNWYKVEYNGIIGYCFDKYIVPITK